MPRGRAKSVVTEPEQPAEIQPGEGVEIRMARLESGEWHASIGASDDENAIAFTAAWPREALRGLAKQIPQGSGTLAAYRIGGDQEAGPCEHATPDGRMCVVLQCPTGGAEAVAQALQAGRDLLGSQFPMASTNEIVRLYGVMKEPVLRGKGEEGHLLTATFEVVGENLTPEFLFLNPSAKKQVAAFVYHAYAPPKSADIPLGQRSMDFEGGNGQAEGIEVLMCPVCMKEVHAEGQEPGMACPLCENGILEIRQRTEELETAADSGDQPAETEPAGEEAE